MVLGKLPVNVRKNLAREPSHLDWTLDQPRQSIAKEIRVLEAGAFIPPSQPEDQHQTTASFLTGATNRLTLRNHWSVHFVRDYIQLPNVMSFQTSLNTWTLSNGRNCVLTVSVIIESINASQRAAVNAVRIDIIPVCAEEYTTHRILQLTLTQKSHVQIVGASLSKSHIDGKYGAALVMYVCMYTSVNVASVSDEIRKSMLRVYPMKYDSQSCKYIPMQWLTLLKLNP